jgi:hypothetical protein
VRRQTVIAPDWHGDQTAWTRVVRLWLDGTGRRSGNLRSPRWRNKHGVLRLEPTLRARGLAAGLVAETLVLDAPALAVACARGAATCGAAILSHTSLEGTDAEGAGVLLLRVRDQLASSDAVLRARLLVRLHDAPNAPVWQQITVARRRLDVQQGSIAASALDGTTLVVLPDERVVHVARLQPVPSDRDDDLAWVTALLRGVNAAFPSARLSHGDVHHAERGAAPVGGHDVPTFDADGVLQLRTPLPLFAAVHADDVTARIIARLQTLGIAPSPSADPSPTLAGGDAADIGPLETLGREAGMPPEIVARILRRYGTEAAAIFHHAARDRALGQPIHPEEPAIAAEVLFAVRRSFAATVRDVLTGRLGLHRRTSDGGAAAADLCARLLGREFGWTDDQCRDAAAAYVATTARAASRLAALGA